MKVWNWLPFGGVCFQGRTNWFLCYLGERGDCKQEAPAINKSEHFSSFSFPHAHGTLRRTGTVKSQYVVLMCPEWKCDWGDAKAWWRKRFVLMKVIGRWGTISAPSGDSSSALPLLLLSGCACCVDLHKRGALLFFAWRFRNKRPQTYLVVSSKQTATFWKWPWVPES